jgi:hypothetical protein
VVGIRRVAQRRRGTQAGPLPRHRHVLLDRDGHPGERQSGEIREVIDDLGFGERVHRPDHAERGDLPVHRPDPGKMLVDHFGGGGVTAPYRPCDRCRGRTDPDHPDLLVSRGRRCPRRPAPRDPIRC